MDGVVPSVPVFDTWAALARNPKTIEKLLDAISPSVSCSTTQPNRILYPTDWYPLANKEQQQMTEDFLAVLESALGVQHTKISLKEEWQRTAPEELRSKTLPEYMAKVHQFFVCCISLLTRSSLWDGSMATMDIIHLTTSARHSAPSSMLSHMQARHIASDGKLVLL